jgi:hypothetical protein
LRAVAEATEGALPAAPLGALSLIFWLLIVTISIKYCLFVMRADNHGEGGILALMSLTGASWHGRGSALIVMGLFGAALIYGDGIITPAISVLSALEGLNQAPGNVFNDYNFGGYLIAHHVLTFIDGRGVIFGDLFRKYLTGKITDDDLDRYGVTWALLRPEGHMSDRWESLCADDIAVVWRPRAPH